MQTEVKQRIDILVDDILDWDESRRIDFVKKLLSACNRPHERYVVIMLYIYGLRPAELMLMTKDKFRVGTEEIRVRLPTVKKGQRRIIDLSINDTPFMNELIDYLTQDTDLLPSTWNHTTNINAVFRKIAKRLGTQRLSPYTFREFRMSFLASELDASAIELQTWKGAKDMRSVTPYVRMKPIKKFSKLIR